MTAKEIQQEKQSDKGHLNLIFILEDVEMVFIFRFNVKPFLKRSTKFANMLIARYTKKTKISEQY